MLRREPLTSLLHGNTAVEHSSEDDMAAHEPDESNWPRSLSGAAADSNGFDCNICLDPVQDPVVTLCGHLYCWPCIYKWLEFPEISFQDMDQPQQCPICKSEISLTALIPLYGRGQVTRNSKTKHHQQGIAIPSRPLSPVLDPAGLRPVPRASSSSLSSPQELHGVGHLSNFQRYISHRGYPPAPALLSSTVMSIINLIVGIFGEMVIARVFGNSLTDVYTYPSAYHLDGSSPRVRRLMAQANKSLSRICFFLSCCCILCLLLF